LKNRNLVELEKPHMIHFILNHVRLLRKMIADENNEILFLYLSFSVAFV